MRTLTEFKIRVGPREFGVNQLSEAQQALVKELAEKAVNRGGFAKVRLTNMLKEEMRFAARSTGGQTQAEIDYLLNGLEIAFGEEEKDDQG